MRFMARSCFRQYMSALTEVDVMKVGNKPKTLPYHKAMKGFMELSDRINGFKIERTSFAIYSEDGTYIFLKKKKKIDI